MTLDPKLRFLSRVDDYVRFRPRYPSSLLRVLQEEMALDPQWVVADVGSGTGISSEPFLDNGNMVFAVEPNPEMRAAAERILTGRTGFQSIAGSAEATGLGDDSVDLVVAGQAFHWFDQDAARKEFARILRFPRRVALFWNTRLHSGSPLAEDYESLLKRFGTDYRVVRHDQMDRSRIDSFFGGSATRRTVPNHQSLDDKALLGRIRSSSYTPSPDHANHPAMLDAARALFEAHHIGGRVTISYETEIFSGHLS